MMHAMFGTGTGNFPWYEWLVAKLAGGPLDGQCVVFDRKESDHFHFPMMNPDIQDKWYWERGVRADPSCPTGIRPILRNPETGMWEDEPIQFLNLTYKKTDIVVGGLPIYEYVNGLDR